MMTNIKHFPLSELKKSLLTGEVVRDVDYKRKRISAQEALCKWNYIVTVF